LENQKLKNLFTNLENKEFTNNENNLTLNINEPKSNSKDTNLSFTSSSSLSSSSSVTSCDSASSFSAKVLPQEQTKTNKKNKKPQAKHPTLLLGQHRQNNYVETNELNFEDMNMNNREKGHLSDNELQFEQESLINSQNPIGKVYQIDHWKNILHVIMKF
jgi:hypothetical protein